MFEVLIENIINELIDSIPYPVIFKKDLGGTSTSTVIGRWKPSNGMNQYSIIEIRDGQSEYQTLSTLLHEIGHTKCTENKCKCTKVKSADGELHANTYMLRWLLKHKCKTTLKIEMFTLLKSKDRTDYYGDSIRQLIKTPIWKKCNKYIKPPRLKLWVLKIAKLFKKNTDWLTKLKESCSEKTHRTTTKV